MSRRKIVMCTILRFGAAPLCVRRKNAPLFARSNKSVCAIPFASVMPKVVFLVGGIIGCWRFKKIADSASTRFLPANHWPNVAPPPGSIAKCARAKILPITRRSGQSFLLCHPERAPRSRRISNYLSARPSPVVILKSQAMRENRREQFQRSVVYIDKTGQVLVAAEAVYRSLRCRPSKKWLWWSYQHIPGFAAVSELGYNFIARHRGFASAITQLLWGKDVRPPTYFWAHRWFLRALALVYLIAFVSLWIQIDGLVGANGILPIRDYLSLAHREIGYKTVWILPTLCWFNSSNGFLHFLCGSGVLFSLLLICRIAPAISLGVLFVSYLSLSVAGQAFLSFQWDILLLETGFVAIFFAPWQLWPRSATAAIRPVSPVAMFLLKVLLFKLMFMSGVVKLTSGDNCWGWINQSFHWSALTALDYHYWTQPLPTVFAWFADKHPEWFKKFSVAFCLVVEIIVPFFIWAPRRPRLIAAGLLIFLQLAIAITGNYCFFNLLTIALCLLLIDDATWRAVAAVARRGDSDVVLRAAASNRGYNFAAIIVLIVTLPLNLWLCYTALKPEAEWPEPLLVVYAALA